MNIDTKLLALKGTVLALVNPHGYKVARNLVHMQMANGTYELYSDEYYRTLQRLYNSHLAAYHACGDHFAKERAVIAKYNIDLVQIDKDHKGEDKERSIRFDADKLTQFLGGIN